MPGKLLTILWHTMTLWRSFVCLCRDRCSNIVWMDCSSGFSWWQAWSLPFSSSCVPVPSYYTSESHRGSFHYALEVLRVLISFLSRVVFLCTGPWAVHTLAPGEMFPLHCLYTGRLGIYSTLCLSLLCHLTLFHWCLAFLRFSVIVIFLCRNLWDALPLLHTRRRPLSHYVLYGSWRSVRTQEAERCWCLFQEDWYSEAAGALLFWVSTES